MKKLSVTIGPILLAVVCGMTGCNGFTVVSKGSQPNPARETKHVTGAGDSPVVVRGGAMTARTKDKTNGWKPSNNGFCTGITLTSSTLYFNYDGIGAVPTYLPPPPKSFPAANGDIPLTANGWDLKILGRNYVPNTAPTPSHNGSDITWVPSCTGAAAGSTVYVQLSLTGTYPGFYDSDADGISAVVTGKRFRDLTPLKKPGTNCFGPNRSSGTAGDEDACERASLVTLTNTAGGTTTTYSGWCTNGECVVGLGDQD
jgi:hypothetical protein